MLCCGACPALVLCGGRESPVTTILLLLLQCMFSPDMPCVVWLCVFLFLRPRLCRRRQLVVPRCSRAWRHSVACRGSVNKYPIDWHLTLVSFEIIVAICGVCPNACLLDFESLIQRLLEATAWVSNLHWIWTSREKKKFRNAKLSELSLVKAELW